MYVNDFKKLMNFTVQVTVYDSEMNSRYTIQCELEPVFLLCGPKSIALGMNNHSWLYSSLDGQLLRKLQFVASVQSISLNETHMAALVDGRVYLQHVPTVFQSLLIIYPNSE